MKKLLLSLLVLSQAAAFAQFTFADHDGNTIENNSIVTFTTHTSEDAKLKFHITNTGSNPIDVRIRCESITNSNGVGFQLCYGGLCHDDVEAGGVYPDFEAIIAPGGNNGDFDYFVNNFAGAGQFPIDYAFSIYTVDNTGLPTGEAINFTYRYAPDMSVSTIEELKNAGIKISNTIIEDHFAIDVTSATTVTVFNLNGQLIKGQKVNSGNHHLDFSDLSRAYYIVQFTNSNGLSNSIKVLKK